MEMIDETESTTFNILETLVLSCLGLTIGILDMSFLTFLGIGL